jgi:hypothetical protein
MSPKPLIRFLALPALLAGSLLASPGYAQVACTLTCPANINTSTPPGAGAVTVNYPIPVSQGADCSGPPVQTAGLPTGSAFPVGTTTNVWAVPVTGGGFVSCQWTVTVIGTPAAPISVPTNSYAGLMALLAGLLGIGLLLRRRPD